MEQQQRCLQGSSTALFGASMQMQHVPSASSFVSDLLSLIALLVRGALLSSSKSSPGER